MSDPAGTHNYRYLHSRPGHTVELIANKRLDTVNASGLSPCQPARCTTGTTSKRKRDPYMNPRTSPQPGYSHRGRTGAK
ncbi:hypothetical protein GCM10017710_25960 [Arthrobacter ramosus]